MAFSTSSLTTLAGRSTTSPAAMRLTMVSGNWRIGMEFPLNQFEAGGHSRRRGCKWMQRKQKPVHIEEEPKLSY